MNFTVVWTTTAEGELANAWMAATDRAAVTAAAQQVEAELARAADTAGESRQPGVRILLAEPLGVLYTVVPASRTAYVFRLWSYG